ncbi:hypothetical protein [Methylosinus sp. Sm6]|uniref:hypothetical protein n=1 Tax=Methylosinus sp. Sm6 TaxID=2866948 RepID=UPI002104D2C9|nr:hypothetical protein [Methylosinus sp. Sm6]
MGRCVLPHGARAGARRPRRAAGAGGALDALTRELKDADLALWDIEDRIRACEKRQDFGDEFVALARGVYQRNDHRALLKRRTDDLCGSAIVEEKSYDEAQQQGRGRALISRSTSMRTRTLRPSSAAR